LKEKSTILERIGDAFFAVDLNWIITYWNNRAESILGRKREDVLGQNLWDVYIDAVNTPFQTNYEAAMSSGEPRYFEAHYEGTNAWYEVSVFPSPTGLSIFFKDVTERRKYINAIENHNETLRQIAWSQSHEVRSPLVRIMGLVNLVQELELDASAQLIEILDMIVLSANDLDAVIWKINDKTKIN
jgi:PAS domain S-box-containing protein